MNALIARSVTAVAAVSLLLAAGCSSRSTPIAPPLDTAYTLQINQQFESLPNYSRIYFQNGSRVIQGNLDRWTTYCRLQVYNRDYKADYLTSVEPGIFQVSAVANRLESSRTIAGQMSPFGYFSSPSGLLKTSNLSDGRHFDPPSYYLYRVEMKLASTDQPDVQTLTCSKKWATRGNYYPTLSEIRTALGEAVRLHPAQS